MTCDGKRHFVRTESISVSHGRTEVLVSGVADVPAEDRHPIRGPVGSPGLGALLALELLIRSARTATAQDSTAGADLVVSNDSRLSVVNYVRTAGQLMGYGDQISSVASPEFCGVGSGIRLMRNELNTPMRPARMGMSRAT
jgi:hypothetical protein